MTADDRDKQIANLIRSSIKDAEYAKQKLKFPQGSPEDMLLDGKIRGLREALGYVDPQPWQ